EVAYFNPGQFRTTSGTQLDQAWAHVRYLPSTGQIWLATKTGGFWVLELEPQVRAALGLPALPVLHPQGTAPRPAATLVAVPSSGPVTAYYCTVNGLRLPG